MKNPLQAIPIPNKREKNMLLSFRCHCLQILIGVTLWCVHVAGLRAQAPEPIRAQLGLDLAQYQDAHRQSYLEIYYSIPQAPATSSDARMNDNRGAEFLFELRIHHGEVLWATKTWKIAETPRSGEKDGTYRELVDVLRFQISQPGQYRTVLSVRDITRTGPPDSAAASVQVRAFSPENVEVSGVIIASQITKAAAAANRALVRNTYEIVPNPRRLFGEEVPVLYFYFEAYNLHAESHHAYKSYWQVEDGSGTLVAGMGPFYRTKTNRKDSSIEMGMLNVGALPTGVYALVYGVADSTENIIASARKAFYVYDSTPQQRVANSDPIYMMLSRSGADELHAEFERMQHITRKEDVDLFKSLANAEAKRQFLAALWESHKPESYADGPTFRQVYLMRVRQAEEQFPTVLRPGWKSDRGRVFILYGPPSHVERISSHATAKPYEIWTYNDLQGGVTFVFVDRTGFRNYELVHSTHRNELQNPDWERLVLLGSGIGQ